MNVTVDIGNYSTILTFGEQSRRTRGLLQGVGRVCPDDPLALFVPSLVNVSGEPAIGEEVLSKGLYEDQGTFRDLKDHAAHSSPVGRPVGTTRIRYKDAAAVFLSELLRRLRAELDEPLDVVIFFPTWEGETFRDWLRSVDLPHARSVTLLDEDTAVALGYGLNLFQEDLIIFFDFGFSAVRARLVQFSWRGRDAYAPPTVRASVVLPAGLADIILRVARRLQPGGLEKAWYPAFPWEPFTPEKDFLAAVEKNDLDVVVQKAVDRLREAAEAKSIDRCAVKKVCLIGFGTRLPTVRAALEKNFGDLLREDIPQTAAGRGGLLFLAERPVDDMVRGDYALRVRDPVSGEHHYPVVVERYTRFPTKGSVSRFIVNTFYDGQYEMQVEIFRSERSEEDLSNREIVYGDDGKISFVSSHGEAPRERVGTPVVIPVNPPGRIGERRILLEFRVDGQKRLLLTARDLREDKTLWEEKPIADLR